MSLLGGVRRFALVAPRLFTELRELVFAKATEGAARARSRCRCSATCTILSLRFHLERQTGGMTRDIERGTRAVHSLISFSLYSVLPTIIEVVLVLTLLGLDFSTGPSPLITGVALVLYIVTYTITVTEWRTKFRRQLNETRLGHAHAGH